MRSLEGVGLLQCNKIKSLVEKFSGIKNIGTDSRANRIPDLRKIYCKLCKTHTGASYKSIGSVLHEGYHYSSVIYAVNTFDDLFYANQLDFVGVFYSVTKYLSAINK